MWCPPAPDRALPRQWWDKPLEVSRAFSLPRATCHCRLQGLSDPFSLTLPGQTEPAASLPQTVRAATLCLLSLHVELLLASSSGHPPKHSRHRCSHPPLAGPVGHENVPHIAPEGHHTHMSRCRACWVGERRSWLLGQPTPTICSWAGGSNRAGARSQLCRENVENPRTGDVQVPTQAHSEVTSPTLSCAAPTMPADRGHLQHRGF